MPKLRFFSSVSQSGMSHCGEILSLLNTDKHAGVRLKVPYSVLKPYVCNILNIFIITYISIPLKKGGFIENFNWGSLYNVICKTLNLGHI